MSPRNKTFGPKDPPPPERINETLSSILDLPVQIRPTVNILLVWSRSILGLKRKNGCYVLPVPEIARLMGVDEKTASKFMRRGQKYETEVSLGIAVAAFELAHLLCGYYESIIKNPGRDRRLKFFIYPEEVENFRRKRDQFMEWRNGLFGLLPQPLLPFGHDFGEESGLLGMFESGMGGGSRPNGVLRAGVFGSLRFDHNKALECATPLQRLSLFRSGRCQDFYIFLGIEGKYANIPLCLAVKNSLGKKVFESWSVITANRDFSQPVLFPVTGIQLQGPEVLSIEVSAYDRTIWRHRLLAEAKDRRDLFFEAPDDFLTHILGDFPKPAVRERLFRRIEFLLELWAGWLIISGYRLGLINGQWFRRKLRFVLKIQSGRFRHQESCTTASPGG
ncbi:MAG TPA: hypothetical protein VK914_13485 [bacterium]|jgi:hypothetical protein|nr:hypothetical protein [bacterium]